MKVLGDARISEINNAICGIFLQYDLSEQEVIEIIQDAAIEYILSLKKRLKLVEPKSEENK